MPRGAALSLCLAVALLGAVPLAQAHPLRLSLTEIEYESDSRLLSISLRLFLMDVREALLFDPDNAELAFCQTDDERLDGHVDARTGNNSRSLSKARYRLATVCASTP